MSTEGACEPFAASAGYLSVPEVHDPATKQSASLERGDSKAKGDSLTTKFRVIGVSEQDAKPWILERHYAKKMPLIEECFGIFEGSACVGICSFGLGANINNNSLGPYKMSELNRLVISDGLPKNTASWFVSRCLALLPKPVAVISYADSDFGHVGYIYQATNWIYTGMSEGRRVYVKDGVEFHRKTVYDMLGKHDLEAARNAGFEYHKGKPKHRYFMFLGSRRDKEKMAELLPFDVVPYPKGETARYDTSKEIVTQGLLL